VRIIIIEDDYYTLQTLSGFLEAKGCSTQFHTTIADAVRSLLAEEFDLMLLDYHLPGLNGTDALPIIQEVSPRLPVILMTHETTRDDREKAIRAGASCLLKKPITQRALFQAIRSARPSLQANKAKKRRK
jgi:CheY-like chemotaxis protein